MKRLLEAKLLLILPKSIQDNKLERRYKNIMSANGSAPELMPGGDEAAIGDSTGSMSKDLNNNKISITIETVRNGNTKTIHFEYKKRSEEERPMALDVLMQAQKNTSIPDLAFRYGCRARNCGVCTIDINDRPRVACRARVKNGDKLSAIATLPVLSDLVVRRDGIPRQLRGLKTVAKGNDLNIEAPRDYYELTACIECYACLDKCPMHAKNFGDDLTGNVKDELPKAEKGYKYGNPFHY